MAKTKKNRTLQNHMSHQIFIGFSIICFSIFVLSERPPSARVPRASQDVAGFIAATKPRSVGDENTSRKDIIDLDNIEPNFTQDCYPKPVHSNKPVLIYKSKIDIF